jgi:hypothetical protein
MEINFDQKPKADPTPQEGVKIVNPNQGKVTIAVNLKKEREMLDKDGNVINPITKQIIKKMEDNK